MEPAPTPFPPMVWQWPEPTGIGLIINFYQDKNDKIRFLGNLPNMDSQSPWFLQRTSVPYKNLSRSLLELPVDSPMNPIEHPIDNLGVRYRNCLTEVKTSISNDETHILAHPTGELSDSLRLSRFSVSTMQLEEIATVKRNATVRALDTLYPRGLNLVVCSDLTTTEFYEVLPNGLSPLWKLEHSSRLVDFTGHARCWSTNLENVAYLLEDGTVSFCNIQKPVKTRTMRLFKNPVGKTPYNSVIHWTNHPRVLGVFFPTRIKFYDLRTKDVSVVDHRIEGFPLITAAPVCTNGFHHLISLDYDLEYGTASAFQVLDTRYLRHPLMSWKVDVPPLRNIFTYPHDGSPVAVGYNDCKNIIACPMEVDNEGLYFPKSNAVELGEFVTNMGAVEHVKQGKSKIWMKGAEVEILKAEPWLKGLVILNGGDRLNKPKILALSMFDSLVYGELERSKTCKGAKVKPLTADEMNPPQVFHKWTPKENAETLTRTLLEETVKHFTHPDDDKVKKVTEFLDAHWISFLGNLAVPRTALDLYEKFKETDGSQTLPDVSPFEFYKGFRKCKGIGDLSAHIYGSQALPEEGKANNSLMTPFEDLFEEVKEGDELMMAEFWDFACTVYTNGEQPIMGLEEIDLENIKFMKVETKKIQEDLTLETLLDLEKETKTRGGANDNEYPLEGLIKSLGNEWIKNRPTPK